MTLKDRIKALRGSVNGYRALKEELEETQGDLGLALSEVNALRKELGETNERLQNVSGDCLRLMGELTVAEYKRDAYQAALSAFCPRLKTGEDMKRLYECTAPFLDQEGFKRYFAAKDLLGTYCDELFPYEDARGMFEEADGHTLLRYLTAYHFDAVDWHIVPGTCYEEASLLPVDTSTPEYKAFEKKLYEKTLRSMGFQNLLPEQYEKVKSKTEKGDDAR